jgi:hypothetical protein
MDLAYNFIDKTKNVNPEDIKINQSAESMRYIE